MYVTTVKEQVCNGIEHWREVDSKLGNKEFISEIKNNIKV